MNTQNTPNLSMLKKVEVISELQQIPVEDIFEWEENEINREYDNLMELNNI